VLRQQIGLADSDFASLDAEVLKEIAAAVTFAEAGTWESTDDLTRDVYTPHEEARCDRVAS
jgi:pyruvate dehydrogenase E1 component alpha subunit